MKLVWILTLITVVVFHYLILNIPMCSDLNDIRSKVDCSRCFSLLHVNFRSIKKNYNSLLTSIISIFVSDDYNYQLCDDLLYAGTFADMLFLELLPDNVIIGCVYTPPDGDVTLFTAYLYAVK